MIRWFCNNCTAAEFDTWLSTDVLEDVIRVGQSVNTCFVALITRSTPEVPAIVHPVFAYRLVDPATREPYVDAILKPVEDLPV